MYNYVVRHAYMNGNNNSNIRMTCYKDLVFPIFFYIGDIVWEHLFWVLVELVLFVRVLFPFH